MKKVESIDDVEAFLLKHGENIVDMLGGEIDRIELKLRVSATIITCDRYNNNCDIIFMTFFLFFFAEKVSTNSPLWFRDSIKMLTVSTCL